MAKPTASFTFTMNGLSVQFTDRSSGIVTSRLWDFGDGNTSTDQNPSRTYAAAGVYVVNLSVTNADGTDIYQYSLVVTVAPGIASTIFELVVSYTPPGLAVDGIVFTDSRNKWMIYLQAAFDISDTDLFKEEVWPPLARVLIAKLIVLDMINNAAAGAMLVLANASQTYNQLASQITTGTVMVADYTVAFVITYPVVINLISINGVSFGPSTSLVDANAVINYLNGLSKGQFSFNGTNLQSLGNSNILTTFNYTHAGGGVNTNFTQSNSRIVNVSQSSSSGSTSTGQKGPIKRMEAGPSVVEWYDSSSFWSNMFKSTGGSLVSGQSSGVVGQIQQDVCLYALKYKIYFPFCPALKRVKAPTVFKKC